MSRRAGPRRHIQWTSLVVAGQGRRTIRCQDRFAQRAELEQAFELLATHYKARGYDCPGATPYRFTPYHVLPDTITLVALRESRVSATMSLVPDTSLLGLPMEHVYGTEISDLRRQGRRLAEMTSLADSGLTCSEFIQVFMAFIKIAMHYHIRLGGDQCVIVIHPRHRNFYLKVLGFVPLAPEGNYPSVQGHPAEALLLDVPLMKANSPKMHETIFGELLPESILCPPTWSPESIRHFGGNSTQTDPRTIEDLLLCIERLGSPPRWLEG